MSDTGRAVQIHAATPAGAACAAVLDRAGINVSIFDSSTGPGGLAVVSRGLIAELRPKESPPSQPVEEIIDRKLTEDDALDTVRNRQDAAIIRRADVVDALAHGISRSNVSATSRRGLSVHAGEFRLGHAGNLDDGLFPLARAVECIHLDWSGAVTGRATWFRLTGDALSDVNATASILADQNQTTLILTIPLSSVVETSISVVDVVSRLLAHPRVRCELPVGEPRTASTRILRTGEPVHFSLRGGLTVRIGAAAGLADSVELDRELRSGMVAAEQIAQAIASGRVGVACLSRISRFWSALGKS